MGDVRRHNAILCVCLLYVICVCVLSVKKYEMYVIT